jgi:hypothetical protein
MEGVREKKKVCTAASKCATPRPTLVRCVLLLFMGSLPAKVRGVLDNAMYSHK